MVMSVLGNFDSSLYGKVTGLVTAQAAHIGVTTGVHGAVSAATASKIMIRDASGRVNVVAPAGSDNSTLVPTTAWVLSEISGSGGGTVTSITQGTGMNFSTSPITGTGTINLADTGVSPGTYTKATITVDQQGRITLASNGSAVASVSGTAPVVSSGGSTPAISMAAATASNHGYMTLTQVGKLNGIASGAETNVVDSVYGRTGAVTAQADDVEFDDLAGVTISTSAASGGVNGDIHFRY
jgi:hypothetical protein